MRKRNQEQLFGCHSILTVIVDAGRVFLLLVLGVGASIVQAEEVWIDVRSALEHKIDHIEGDLRVSHTDIVDEVLVRYPDKDTEIKLYCRSGGRAGKALSALNDAGYSKVENVGGIDDARKVRQISETKE